MSRVPPDDRRPVVSVVIPVRNGAGDLPGQLSALARQRDPGVAWELIVSDNGSSDGTDAVVEEWRRREVFTCLRRVDSGSKVGVNHARNVGIEAARGEWVAICDADDEVVEGWLASFVDHIATTTTDLVGGSLTIVPSPDGRHHVWSTVGTTTELGRPMRFLPIVPGGNMFVRREVWRRVGGFDEDWLLPGSNDQKFSWDVQLAGFAVSFEPRAEVRYRARATLRAALRQKHLWCISTPRLYKEYRRHGAQRRSVLGAARVWLVIVVSSWKLLGPARLRHVWLKRVVQNLGYLRGSVRYRVFYP